MKIETATQKFNFPAFFNDSRYDERAINRICDALMELTSEKANPNSPLFKSKFKVLSESGQEQVLELAIFASVSKSGNPYLSCQIATAKDKPAHVDSGNTTPDDDDIPF